MTLGKWLLSWLGLWIKLNMKLYHPNTRMELSLTCWVRPWETDKQQQFQDNIKALEGVGFRVYREPPFYCL